MATVYCIENATNGFKYIGSTVQQVKTRWACHKRLLNNSKHHSKSLQKAWIKDGENNFKWYVIEDNVDDEVCREHEDYYVKLYKTLDRNFGYNEAEPLWGGLLRYSEEIKKKISESNKGKVLSEEQKQRMSKLNKGKVLSEEHRRKISDATKGENNPNYGKTPSDETRKKMSDSHKGDKNYNYSKPKSDETKRKMSEAQQGEKGHNYGKTASNETRLKMSKALQGTNAKLTEAQVYEIIELLKQGELTLKEISEMYGVSRRNIGLIKDNKSWRHLSR